MAAQPASVDRIRRQGSNSGGFERAVDWELLDHERHHPGMRVEVPSLPLHQGTYRIQAWIKCGRDLEDQVTDAAELTVAGGDFFGTGTALPADSGPFLVPHSFRVGAKQP